MIDPEVFGKYHLLEQLGRGSFATVYRAQDPTLGREVALKVLHPQLLTDAGFVARFLREARVLANLRHPHIVTVYEVGSAEGRAYIAMELARGRSLGEEIAGRGQIPWTEALGLLRPVCEALDYAHAQGVVHRDLKPSNILLDAERGPLLTDLGFARLLGDSSQSMSLSGGILGTPAYIAPEVWEFDAATPAADLYALGCIAFEMLTGKGLFSGATPMQAVRAHDRGPQFPESWPPGVPHGVAGVLAVALARDPQLRFPSAMALWHALEGLAAEAEEAREAAERAALAAQWRADAEAALAAGELGAARMAGGRWLKAAPEDGEALAFLERVRAAAVAQEARQAAHTGAEVAAIVREQDRIDAELGIELLEKMKAARRRDEMRRDAQGEDAARGEAARPWDAQAAREAAATPRPEEARRAGPRAAGKVPGWAWALMGVLVAALLVSGALALRGCGSALPTAVVQAPATPRDTLAAAVPTEAPALATGTPLPTAETSTLGIGSIRLREADGMVMVYVPAGVFSMGSPDGEGASDEHPQHQVTLDGFWIDKTEVTNDQYGKCVDAGACAQPGCWGEGNYNGGTQPVVCVSWQDAAAYCAWAGARLPTEAEWEKAARGTDGRTFPWGSSFDGSLVNYCDAACEYNSKGVAFSDGYARTAPVWSYKRGASPYGALDMAGNVWEWVSDWYGSYSSDPASDPQGPASGEYRVLRGGSWISESYDVRSASRLRSLPVNRFNYFGFRCGVSSTSSP